MGFENSCARQWLYSEVAFLTYPNTTMERLSHLSGIFGRGPRFSLLSQGHRYPRRGPFLFSVTWLMLLPFLISRSILAPRGWVFLSAPFPHRFPGNNPVLHKSSTLPALDFWICTPVLLSHQLWTYRFFGLPMFTWNGSEFAFLFLELALWMLTCFTDTAAIIPICPKFLLVSS